ADAAQSTADVGSAHAATALANAAAANALLADIAADNKLTPAEKQATKKEWDVIVSEKTKNDAQADAFSVSKTAYGSAYTTLSNYITPLLANLTTTDTIVGATFRANFKAYYDARTDLLNAIAAKAKTLADAAQSTADVGSAHAATAHAPSDADHTQTTIDGGLVTTGTLQVVQGGTVAAGITGNTAGDTAVRFFAGSTFANRASAPFRVLQNGAIHATSATISGTITSGSGSKIAGFTATTTDMTSGSGSTAIGISTDTEKKAFWAGSTKPASAPFYIEHDGVAILHARNIKMAR
ncbi:MAG TPA: hypothetical protein PLR50_06505, partial [Candidatus Rifleibacterium sp.]|nr:hypothetical protein [Candidatus Rifleibacterium sp.]